ncbi:MAG: signal peptidase I [Alphaproteobacteria bacterium]
MKIIKEYLSTIFLVLLVVIPIRTFAYNQYYVPSGSMVPTLLEGDHVGVTMFAYGFGSYALPFDIPLWEGRFFAKDPKRGDIAVFQHPTDERIDLIKRIIGLPGDKIQVIGGQLLINREPVPTKFLDGVDLAANSTIWRNNLKFSEEFFGGEMHYIADSGRSAFDNTPTFTVPAGHFFAMGDNRDRSNDSRSRTVGYVPMDNLIGRAEIILASRHDNRNWMNPLDWLSLFRGERFMTKLK